MHVDEDRDGTISFFNSKNNKVIKENEYLFWVNTDFDVLHYEEDEWHEDDKIGVIEEEDQDWNDRYIGNKIRDLKDVKLKHDPPYRNKRDLEDFARLQIRVPSLLKDVVDATYSLRFTDVTPDNNPGINLFEGVDKSSLYLTENLLADKQIKKVKLNESVISSEAEYKIPKEFVENNGKISPFIFEGAAVGNGSLILEVKVNDVVISEAKVDLKLYSIKWFYDKYMNYEKFSSYGWNWDSEVFEHPEGSWSSGYKPESSEYFLFVHGWNLPETVKERWTETIFKRLWWLGYKGGVGLFSWPCEVWGTNLHFNLDLIEKILDLQNFNNSEYKAWQSADELTEVLLKLTTEGKKLGVLSHSQGSVVMGEALQKYNGPKIDAYIASQSAISANVYDEGQHLEKAVQKLSRILDFELNEILAYISPYTVLYNNAYFPITTPNLYSNFSDNTVTNLGEPYFANNFSKVKRMYNYFNPQDYALTGYRWELNNVIKPAYKLDYGYSFQYTGSKFRYVESDNPSCNEGDNEFTDCFYHQPDQETVYLKVGNEFDKYKIFSYAADSWVRALGTQEIYIPNGKSFDLSSKGFGFDKEHYSHSRQFRSNFLKEQEYWKKTLDDFDFDFKK